MAPHSSTLAWKIPWMKEPGGLQSMGVTKSWTRLSDFTFMHWRRKWQPTPVFLPGESQGGGSLVGCPSWGCTESDTTKATQQRQRQPEYLKLLINSLFQLLLLLINFLLQHLFVDLISKMCALKCFSYVYSFLYAQDFLICVLSHPT